MKRVWWTVALIVTCVLPLAANGGSEDESVTPEDVEVRLEFFEGEVSVDGAPAEIGQELMPGSRVRTGPQGYAEVVFGLHNILRLEEDSDLVVDLSSSDAQINLGRGAFSAVFSGLRDLGFGRRRSIELRTPSAVGGVRGTSFYFQVENSRSTYVCVCNGTLSLGDSAEEVTAPEHAAYRFIEASGETRRENAPLIYHDNESMDAVAARVDAEIPWGRTP